MAKEPYSIEDLRTAHRAAQKAGDDEAAKVLWDEIIRTRVTKERAYDPTEGMGTVGKFRAGYGRGVVNLGRQVGNIVGLVDDQTLTDAQERDAPLMATGAGRAGSLVGETLTSIPLTGGAAGGVARLGAAGRALVGGAVRRGAFEGAVQGSVTAGPDNRLSGALVGGAAGGAIPAAAAGVGKLARGVERTPEAQRLLDAGVDLTPGQMNPNGIFNQLEESWQNAPIVGASIRGARDNAQRDFQRAVVERGAAPGTRIAQGDQADMLTQAYDSFEPLYDAAKGFDVPQPPAQAFRQAVDDPNVLASESSRQQVASWIDNQLTILRQQNNGLVSSDDLLKLRSDLRAQARRFQNSSDTVGQERAALFDNAQRVITQQLEQTLPQDALQSLRTADAQYGLYKTIEDAVARAKDKPGGFTANDLAQAVVASSGRGANKGRYARGGGGDLRELAQAGKSSFNTVTPPTGARVMAQALPVIAGSAAPVVGIPAGLGALALTTTRTGRRIAAGQTRLQRLAQRLGQNTQRALPARDRELLAALLQRAAVSGVSQEALE